MSLGYLVSGNQGVMTDLEFSVRLAADTWRYELLPFELGVTRIGISASFSQPSLLNKFSTSSGEFSG